MTTAGGRVRAAWPTSSTPSWTRAWSSTPASSSPASTPICGSPRRRTDSRSAANPRACPISCPTSRAAAARSPRPRASSRAWGRRSVSCSADREANANRHPARRRQMTSPEDTDTDADDTNEGAPTAVIYVYGIVPADVQPEDGRHRHPRCPDRDRHPRRHRGVGQRDRPGPTTRHPRGPAGPRPHPRRHRARRAGAAAAVRCRRVRPRRGGQRIACRTRGRVRLRSRGTGGLRPVPGQGPLRRGGHHPGDRRREPGGFRPARDDPRPARGAHPG